MRNYIVANRALRAKVASGEITADEAAGRRRPRTPAAGQAPAAGAPAPAAGAQQPRAENSQPRQE